MRLDKINNVFRPGDYSFDLKWFKTQDALETLLSVGSTLQSANVKLVITQYQREILEPFTWSKDNIQNVLLDCITRYTKLRGDNRYLDKPMMIFRTNMEGIDLAIILQIIDPQKSSVKAVNFDFEELHLSTGDGILTYELLQILFTDLILNSFPDYAVLRRFPPVTADWYWETQAKVDVQKVPITFEWLNFFSWEWVKRIGEAKFNSCPVGEVKRLPIGLLFFMQEEPFSYNNSEHVYRQQRVNSHFDLKKLHKKYTR